MSRDTNHSFRSELGAAGFGAGEPETRGGDLQDPAGQKAKAEIWRFESLHQWLLSAVSPCSFIVLWALHNDNWGSSVLDLGAKMEYSNIYGLV